MKSKWGGVTLWVIIDYVFFFDMKAKSLKTYQVPLVVVVNMELVQSVLDGGSGFSNTEELEEEDFIW